MSTLEGQEITAGAQYPKGLMCLLDVRLDTIEYGWVYATLGPISSIILILPGSCQLCYIKLIWGS